MRRGSLERRDAGVRARRWDVMVLGSALPGLAAAVRLGRAGLRVVVVEEEAATRIAPLLREPFSLAAVRPDGIVQSALKALGVAPIDRKRLEPEPIAHQVLLRDARIDFGVGNLTADELVAWGIAKPDAAGEWVAALEQAGQSEAEALLASPFVRRSGLRGRALAVGTKRALPRALAQASPAFARINAAQLRVLTHLGSGTPAPAAATRVLATALDGGAFFRSAGLRLRNLLRRRIEELHGEFRDISGAFDLVEVGGHPGIARRQPAEAWLGRALLLNAPPACLAEALARWDRPVPSFLRGAEPTRRRAALQLRCPREALPEALAPRAIWVPEGFDPENLDGPQPLGLAMHPSDRGPSMVDLVLTRNVPNDAEALSDRHDEMEADLAGLLPFARDRWERKAVAAPAVWDDELALLDPGRGRGWPAEVELPRSGRPPVHRLAREESASLGSEGDLLLGWRVGDALAEELA